MQAVAASGVPVSVLALVPGAGGGTGGFEVRYLPGVGAIRGAARPGAPGHASSPAEGGARGAHQERSASSKTRRLGPLLRELAGDLSSLRLHPRRSARATRLALAAWRGARLVPAGTARLHAHFANDAGTLARYLSLLTGLPYGVTAHAWDIWQDPFLLGRNLSAADRAFTVSHANVAALREIARQEDWDASRISVLRCGLDLSRFPYRDPPQIHTPARLICVARLVEKKGHDTLLRALAILRQRGVEAALTLVGDGPLRQAIEDQIDAEGLRDRVRLLGALPEENTIEEIRNADVMVLAARIAADGDRDGLPVSLVEAMALGVPVVSTAVSGIPEAVTRETGYLVEIVGTAADPEALASGLLAAIETPQSELAGRMRRARKLVESEFDVQRQGRHVAPAGLPS